MTNTAPSQKARRRPEQRPDEILDAALDLFVTQGFHRTTVEQIARAAQLSKGAVYLYFPSKPDLLVALVRRGVGSLAEQAAAELRSFDGDPRRALRKLFTHLGQRISQDPNFAKVPRLILHEAPSSPALADIYRAEVIDKALPALIDLLRRGMQAGLIRQLDPEMTARAVLGPILAHLLLAEIFGIHPTADQSPGDHPTADHPTGDQSPSDRPKDDLDWQRLLDTQLAILEAGLAPEAQHVSDPR